MNKYLILFSMLLTQVAPAQFNAQNITLLSQYDDVTIPAEPNLDIRYNGIWGWDDGNGHEYACIGASNGVHIIEVTNSAAPQFRAFIPGCVTNSIWRELKTYDKYLFMVSDDAGANCLQIADLSYLPDSVHIVHQSDSIIKTSHTIFVNKNRLYCGGVRGSSLGSGLASMVVFDISNPAAPVLLRKLSDDYPAISYVHDMYVRNDTVYASAAYQGMHIYLFDTLTNTFNQLASFTTYPASGYNHSSALSADGKTLIFADEVPTGLPLKSVDISDLQNITWLTNFRSTPASTATPHNPFMKYGHYIIVGYYQDGVQIFDVSNPSFPIRTGFFDTNPSDGAGLANPNYTGCWGVYVDLPSGNILASDMQNGLFVLNANTALGQTETQTKFINVYPNPASNVLTLNTKAFRNPSIKVYDALCNLMPIEFHKFDNNQSSAKVSGLTPGIYVVVISDQNGSATSRFQIVH